MNKNFLLEGFSKKSKEEKIKSITEITGDPKLQEDIISYWHPSHQKIFDEFSENTITNYYLPFGIAPNFLIDGKIYHVPMVIEESSVVAAAASAAKFWSARGGFRTCIVSTLKPGHVHFLWKGNKDLLLNHAAHITKKLLEDVKPLVTNMERRGGGISSVTIEDKSAELPNYYRIAVNFDTADSMGANFINTVLEAMAASLQNYFATNLEGEVENLEVIMSILSNYTPHCLVECKVCCPTEKLDKIDGEMPYTAFARRFKTAVDIANIDIYRAATHNKGIMNGADAVILATGNDFRATEAGVHAYASRNGQYRSLSEVSLNDDIFEFKLTLPLAVGTVGGLTTLHPMAKRAMQILGNPGARELMSVIAAAGLANNFSAIKALITKGIQKGHMKMHLSNILSQFELSEAEQNRVNAFFKDKVVSVSAVRSFIETNFRKNEQ